MPLSTTASTMLEVRRVHTFVFQVIIYDLVVANLAATRDYVLLLHGNTVLVLRSHTMQRLSNQLVHALRQCFTNLDEPLHIQICGILDSINLPHMTGYDLDIIKHRHSGEGDGGAIFDSGRNPRIVDCLSVIDTRYTSRCSGGRSCCAACAWRGGFGLPRSKQCPEKVHGNNPAKSSGLVL